MAEEKGHPEGIKRVSRWSQHGVGVAGELAQEMLPARGVGLKAALSHPCSLGDSY